jgi:enoyl-CoA hydratase/carnithine racemase
MAYEAIRYELTDAVATITLNRPNVHNAMNERMREELTGCFAELAQSAEARVIVVTGAGEKAFSAGADIREFVTPQVPVKFRDGRRRVDFRAAMDRCGQPIIAAIRGFALGGGLELALACDIRIAGEDSLLGLTEVNLAIIPGGGGTQRLPRLVGPNKALELNLVGDAILSEEALELGLVNRVVPDHELFEAALMWGRKLAGQAPLAVEQIKSVSHKGDLDEGIAAEKQGFATAFGSEDAKEGIAAFLGKRTPKWSGQ